jgi:hypothetical protein
VQIEKQEEKAWSEQVGSIIRMLLSSDKTFPVREGGFHFILCSDPPLKCGSFIMRKADLWREEAIPDYPWKYLTGSKLARTSGEDSAGKL